MSKKDEPKKLGKNGVDMGDRGVYDKRNTLNDLTGKEWVFFTNSVWITGYSPTAKENVGLKYRKIHPSPKPPALMKDIIEFFTKADGKILDKTTPRLIQFHTLKNAVNPPFLGGFLFSGTVAA